jgi:hypothetical protein
MAKGINLLLLVLVLLTSTVIICAAQPLPGGFQGNVAGPEPFNSNGLDYMEGQPDIQSDQNEPETASMFGGYGDNEGLDQAQLSFGKPSKLKCYIWTDKDIYMTDERINLYYRINKPCYVKIVIYRPDSTQSTIGPTWKNAAGTYSIPGVGKEPFGDRKVSLKAWTKATKTKPQQVCRSSCTYAVGFVGLYALSDGSSGENGEPSDGSEPSDEYGVPSDGSEPSDEYGEPSDGSEPSDEYGVPSDGYSGPSDEYGEPQ